MRSRKCFTGCWTCRSRRLKCDETNPNCLQCTTKGLKCEGYSAKLQWVHESWKPSQKSLQRRRLLPASKLALLNEEEIETALFDVENPPSDTSSKSRGPFSVFRLEGPDERPDVTSSVLDHVQMSHDQIDVGHIASSSADVPAHTRVIDDTEPSTSDDHGMYLNHGATKPPYSIGHMTDLHRSLLPRQVDDVVVTPISPQGSRVASNLINPAKDSLSASLSGTYFFAKQPASPLRHTTTWNEVFLNSEVKYLLHNYAHNVLPIFSPLEIPNSPWRQHHLSCALQCSIEMEILGDSSPSKKALLHTILTISAYNLRNTLVQRNQSETSIQWNRVASHYKGEALKLLEIFVGDLTSRVPDDVYNELLAAMLAMVSIDVISGDTKTSEMHLDACETLIRMQLSQDSHAIPHITKALHGIFLYLRTMQEATRVFCDQYESNISRRGSSIVASATPVDYDSHEDIISLIAPQADMVGFNWWSCELVYGLPISLLLLLRKAAKLLENGRQVDTEASQRPADPEMRLKVDQLEDEILEWPIDDAVAWLGTAPLCPGNRLIMQHYTQAFHQALIIFYCYQARKMHQRHLQQYVQQVIFHLEHAETAKKEFGLRAGSMLWPAFVAGSHALSQVVRMRILQWLDLLDREGIWTSRLTKDALMDNWSRGNICPWATSSNIIHIMLT